MLGGVLLFGGVSWVLHRSPDWTPAEPGATEQIVRVAQVAWIVVVGALVVMFLKYRRAEHPSRKSTLAILAWAQAETLALLGGVIFFLTDAQFWYLAGVLLLVLALVAFPPPANR
jgi:peptidoglycan/LPS O-acetylase OafA/YrhL